jgi:hypothetical protein
VERRGKSWPYVFEFAQICEYKTREKSFMSYVRNDFTVTQKILETKWISSRKKSGNKIPQI